MLTGSGGCLSLSAPASSWRERSPSQTRCKAINKVSRAQAAQQWGRGGGEKAFPKCWHCVLWIRNRARRLSLPAAEQLAWQEKVILQRGTVEQGSGMWFIQGVAGMGLAQGCPTPCPVYHAPVAGLASQWFSQTTNPLCLFTFPISPR